MQLFVAPVSINALHMEFPILVGKVVPCSVPMITSSVLRVSCSGFMFLYSCDLLYSNVVLVISSLFSHCSSSVSGISLSSCSKLLNWVASEFCSSCVDSSSIACNSLVISWINAAVCLALSFN